MGTPLVTLSQVTVLLGWLIIAAVQVIVFLRIVRINRVKGLLALLIPGYVIYYIWYSENRMPRMLGALVVGVVLMVGGAIAVGLVMEM
jgi:hypothetical protein